MSVRFCPKCGYRDDPCWKRSFQGNPNGDIDVARIDNLHDWDSELARAIRAFRGQVYVREPFAYFLGKKAIWVKRVEARLYREGGVSVFNIPHESGKPKKGAKQ